MNTIQIQTKIEMEQRKETNKVKKKGDVKLKNK
jgi:hypothetical protein